MQKRAVLWLAVLVTVVVSLPAKGQALVKFGYHRAETVPAHGGMVAARLPLSDEFRVVSAHLRGEIGYGHARKTYGGWRAERVNQSLNAGAGLGVELKLWFVELYAGMTGGVHRFMDSVRYIEGDLRRTPRAPGDTEPWTRINRTSTTLFRGFDDGVYRYVGRMIGLALDFDTGTAAFVEYRQRMVIGWTGRTPPNPYHSLFTGFSVSLF